VETEKDLADLDRHRSGSRGGQRAAFASALAVAVLGCLAACKPPLVAGEYRCPKDISEGGAAPGATDPISVPWETSFENLLSCDYERVAGFCYGFPPAVFRVVPSPVHSGQFAAEFTVQTGTDAGDQPQGRCVRQGVLPTEAYYGAWLHLPKSATNNGLWNLFHFRGGDGPDDIASHHGLWDVSLDNGPTGELNLFLLDFLNGGATESPPIPIGAWFHVVLHLKRAKDRSGEVALYLNGKQVVAFSNLMTDDTDWGQWYVGNLASNLQPSQATVYVDDVTIRSTL
jgi:hypothetical protein